MLLVEYKQGIRILLHYFLTRNHPLLVPCNHPVKAFIVTLKQSLHFEFAGSSAQMI